ncbi:MAG: hypothetical protein ACRDS0_03995 [Pseudonocardiaceae bacterium]
MCPAQPGPRSRPGRQDPALDGPGPAGSATASTSGDGHRPHLPRNRRAGAVAFPGPTSHNAPAQRHPSELATGAGAADPALAPLPLTGDLYDWMALRRVSGGGIARTGDHWLEHGHRIPSYIADALGGLCDNGAVALAELDVWGMRRAALTNAGTVRYRQLCRQRNTARPRPTPVVPWLADHPHARNVVQSVWDTLAELQRAGHHPGPIGALRRVLTHHQPTPAGRCRACRRWRCRRRRFPCIVWHQIHAALHTAGAVRAED